MPHDLPPDIADFLVRSRQCEIAGLEHLLDASQLIGHVRSLVHALQRERGASTLFLNSHGQVYTHRMASYRAEADEDAQRLNTQLAHWLEAPRCHHAGSRLHANIAMALHALHALPSLRTQIDGFKVDIPEAMQRYNEVVQRLLGVVFEAADTAADPGVSRALVALVNFMQGKELAGQERAIGVAGFSSGWQDESTRQTLMHRIDAQERCFQIFAEFAEEDALSRWQQVLSAPITAETERLRRLACTLRPNEGDGLDLAQIWFEQTTRRIDAMKQIEDDLEARLHTRCEERLIEANAGLMDVEARIAELAQQGRSPLPVGVLYGRPVESDDPDLLITMEHRHVEGRDAPLGRSLIDLVQQQSKRLQTMEDELHAAREALAERKLVEQAKALLIKHRGMTEDEAHRMLRKTAMDQGKRLIEVARAAIAMADMLGAKL